jgi:uncharacterized protein (TIGR00725 family)
MTYPRSSSESAVATILGSDSVLRGTQEYEDAFDVGSLLASKGFAVANGGYGGIMEASHHGARSLNGHTIAVITLPRAERNVNQYAVETIVAGDLIERSQMLYQLATIIVVLSADLHTMGDLTYAWALNKAVRVYKPVFLIGRNWSRFISVLAENLLIEDEDLRGNRVLSSVAELGAYLSNRSRNGLKRI